MKYYSNAVHGLKRTIKTYIFLFLWLTKGLDLYVKKNIV